MAQPAVSYTSTYGDYDPMREVIERWMGREFPLLSSGRTDDVMIAVVEEIIASKQYRVGPRPNPESEVLIRDAVRQLVSAQLPINVLIPSAAVKLPFGSNLDVAELAALKVLDCLNRRVKRHYAPGISVRMRMEDLTEYTITRDQPSIELITAQYISQFARLVKVLGYSEWMTLVPESSLVDRDSWDIVTDEYTQLFLDFLNETDDKPNTPVPQSSILSIDGWKGGVSLEMREYLKARYRKSYPNVYDAQHNLMMARYLSAILARKALGATGAVPGKRVELTFAPALPDAPLASPRVYYRTVPLSQTSMHIPYWAAKGYLVLSDHQDPTIKVVQAGTLVPNITTGTIQITGEDGSHAYVQADYVLG